MHWARKGVRQQQQESADRILMLIDAVLPSMWLPKSV
jgi:hypothetical protein